MKEVIARWCTAVAAVMLLGCPPPIDTQCIAGQAHCLVKADGTCDPGLRVEALDLSDNGELSELYEGVRLHADSEANTISACCPLDEPAPFCQRLLQPETTYYADGTTTLVPMEEVPYLQSNEVFVLRLSSGVQFLTREAVSLHSLSPDERAALRPLPDGSPASIMVGVGADIDWDSWSYDSKYLWLPAPAGYVPGGPLPRAFGMELSWSSSCDPTASAGQSSNCTWEEVPDFHVTPGGGVWFELPYWGFFAVTTN